jgi:DNA-directed RNA polymerase specialized sigma24 family protein
MSATTLASERREALAAFFDAHQRRLERAVYSQTRIADTEIVIEACALAWLRLVRRTDVTLDKRGFHWLATIAIHEARHARCARPEIPSGTFAADCDDERERSDPPGLGSEPIDLVIAAEVHRERIARFARLKPRERRDLLLSAGGYSYQEIATATASSYTAVDRRIKEGRAQLRRDR